MPSAPSAARTPLSGCVDVFCEDAGRVGVLSYLVPDHLQVCVGDAVSVPFGASVRTGVVLGPGDRSKATRDVLEVYGPRSVPEAVSLAVELAGRHFAPVQSVIPRLGPRTRRGNPPITPAPLVLAPGASAVELGVPEIDPLQIRRLLVCAPLVDTARLAALEAHRIATSDPSAQVLVLCPTKNHVTAVLSQFASGAARLDVAPKKDQPSPWKAFVEGSLQVAVSTRTAALWSAQNLAGIVVLDESHPGHLEAVQPHTHARDVASERTLRTGCALTLIADDPSPQALGARCKTFAVSTPSAWPALTLVDRRDFPPGRRLVPAPVHDRVQESLAQQRPVDVIAPTGRTMLRCAACKHREQPGAAVCGACRSPRLEPTGFPPDRLAPMFQGARVLAPNQAASVRPGALVVVFDIDAALKTPSLVPSSRAAAFLYAVARAAGPAGEIMVCTSSRGDELLDALVEHQDLIKRARFVYQAAKALNLPPFGRLVQISVAASAPPRTEKLPGLVLGPRNVAPGEWEVLVRCSDAELSLLGSHLERWRRRSKLRVTVS